MRSIAERERALNMHFREGKGAHTIAREMGLPYSTINTWIRAHRKLRSEQDNPHNENGWIEYTRHYTRREKTPEQTLKERVEQLEMESELMRNFLSEMERRSIPK